MVASTWPLDSESQGLKSQLVTYPLCALLSPPVKWKKVTISLGCARIRSYVYEQVMAAPGSNEASVNDSHCSWSQEPSVDSRHQAPLASSHQESPPPLTTSQEVSKEASSDFQVSTGPTNCVCVCPRYKPGNQSRQVSGESCFPLLQRRGLSLFVHTPERG